MAAEDRYGNRLRRGNRVKDLMNDHGEGEVVATMTSSRGRIIVRWDDLQEELSANARDVALVNKAMR